MTTFSIGQTHKRHSWLGADLVELLTYLDYSGRNHIHKNDIINVNERSPSSMDEVDGDLQRDQSLSQAQRVDWSEQVCEDIWSQLEYRQGHLRCAYPFVVEGDTIYLKPEQEELHYVYKLLLATSRLRSFPKQSGFRQKWAKSFAEVSRFAFSAMLPDYATCKVFDANSDDRKNYYGTNLRDAIKVLARDIKAELRNEEEIETSGDLGIDLVGHIPFSDDAESIPVWLGQCGAQEEYWPDKKLEAHPLNHRAHLSSLNDWQCAMFTPICYRSASGEWIKKRDASGNILIDRIRIMELVQRKDYKNDLCTSHWITSFIQDFEGIKIE